ncbi:MAG: hypothetical protein A2Y17_11755 [Clostridiales bacterium GWF2_38_85]|nr:MAG: hypothetical protein A2Y17_11755 [Clostridiales bacterium GWF2_38_85]HBL85377.1 DJ-1 family protein [Clostridiales bacterium]
MAVYILLADGFEEAEALVPADILIRAGIKVYLTAIGESLVVTGSHGVSVNADIMKDKMDLSELEALVLPGGGKGTAALASSDFVRQSINQCVANGKYIGAICAAPSILGSMGLLTGRRAVCFPSYEKFLDGSIITGNSVEHDDIFITAKAVGASFEFGFELIRVLFGNDEAEKLRKGMYYKSN